MAKSAQDYYEYKPDSTGLWMRKEPPVRNARFERELAAFAGLNPFGNPIVRVVWAGDLMSDVSDEPQLKYRKLWTGLTAFQYRNDAGATVRVKSEKEVPVDKIAAPVYETVEIGRLRWLIEVWQSADDAVRTGRFTDRKDENGKRLFRAVPPEGVYNAFFWIQTVDGRFRDLDDGVLEAVKEMWRYNQTASIEQQTADHISDQRRTAVETAQAAKDVWNTGVDVEILEQLEEQSAREREAMEKAEKQVSTAVFT